MRRGITFRQGASWLALIVLLFPTVASPAIIPVDESTCTLIDAVKSANDDVSIGGCVAGSGPDTIVLETDVTLTAGNYARYGDNGLPPIDTTMTIDGQGFSIARAPAAPVFRIMIVDAVYGGPADLTLENVEITNGESDPSWHGGAIANYRGELTLRNTTISDSVTARRGGGIYARQGDVTVLDSEIRGNVANRGGGIDVVSTSNSPRTLIVRDSLIAENRTTGGGIEDGGGISTFNNIAAIIENSTISGNSADQSGGGIAGFGSSNGSLTIRYSTISGNSSLGGGGGVFSRTHTEVRVVNSTISGNVSEQVGGGLLSSNDRQVTVLHSTIVGNSARSQSGINNNTGNVTVTSSIIAGGLVAPSACSPAVIDGGNNFSDDGTCGGEPIVPGTDYDTVLRDNGGPTETHALFPDSAAIDEGGACALPTDQRGAGRTDAGCDSGAYELALGACCTDGPGIASDCIVANVFDCEAEGGLFLGEDAECTDDLVCTELLVTMEVMSARNTADGVRVAWTTAVEIDTVAFRVLREAQVSREKGLVQVGNLVPSLGGPINGGSYEVLDTSRASRRDVRYYVEDIDVYGKVTRHGPIVVERERGEMAPNRSRHGAIAH